jgi:hypothetical protein
MTEMLGKVLAPFEDKQRDEMIGWVEREMESYPLIDNLTSADGVNWQLGQPSPGSGVDATVWAMLYNEQIRGVVIYTVSINPAEGDRFTFEYFREVCFNPKHMHGPISAEALYIDLALFVQPEREPEPKLNGAGAQA